MPNHKKITFMRSSMPNNPMKAGRKAVIGMERMGAATGFTKSWTQRKLAIKRPSGMATTAHQKNAWPIRHQLNATFLSSSLSFHSAGKAFTTSRGVGTEKRLTNSQCVRSAHTPITTTQAAVASPHLTGDGNSFLIENREAIKNFRLLIFDC